jgi:dTDP-4-dehydrorhamnose reductase
VTAQVISRGLGYLHERTGLYHLAGAGHASRFTWSEAILKLDPEKHEQKVKQLLPVPTSEFPSVAQRPLFSAMECQKFEQNFDLHLPFWEAALELALVQ